MAEICEKHGFLKRSCQICDFENEIKDQTAWADTYFKELQDAKKEIVRYEKALCAILTIAYEDECDEITDIITDSLTGFELNERYEKDALEGKKVIDEIKSDFEGVK